MLKFKYRKVTPTILAEMKALREKGWSHQQIADTFGLSSSTVQYHLTDYYKPQALARAKRSNKKQKESGYYHRSEVKARRKAYQRDYMRERYQNDLEFRQKVIRANNGGRFANA